MPASFLTKLRKCFAGQGKLQFWGASLLVIFDMSNIIGCMLETQALFDVLSDEIRRRILCLLLKEGELCVCELFQALDLPQPKVSRHLGVMRDAGVLSVRREGTWVYYRLDAQLPLWAYKVLESMAQGASFAEDAQRLEVMTNRPARCGI